LLAAAPRWWRMTSCAIAVRIIVRRCGANSIGKREIALLDAGNTASDAQHSRCVPNHLHHI
jgi:hypothetical protein